MKTNAKIWHWRTYVIKYGPENATYKHILLTLSCYMNEVGGSCFPSITELQKTTSLTRPTIVKYLKKASSDGWIVTQKKKSKNNEFERNTYTADIPDRVVKEINYVVKDVNRGSKTDSKGVVKEVNSISSINNSTNNSTEARERKNVSKSLKGIPIPAQAKPLFDVSGFKSAFLDYWIHRKQNYNHWPKEINVVECYRELMKMKNEGQDVVKVLRQTIRDGNKAFYPVNDKNFSSGKNEIEDKRFIPKYI